MLLDHDLFKRCPALVSLWVSADPKPDHVRACFMELAKLTLDISKWLS